MTAVINLNVQTLEKLTKALIERLMNITEFNEFILTFEISRQYFIFICGTVLMIYVYSTYFGVFIVVFA